ncbi:DUF5132 domain-containing protein [Methylocystis sp. WRRC1]|uniref:DUF5132 domain-containing protein n=1 Tax=Methylocystis sp. WRRC1 TaxID=1732014 RepID=UPI001D142EFD|nr:DUF5132 domain-containing protein [Methylocystis sp. WRRC1]MCC3246289.1 DUF5132 domain-containing protein [Methylocystis sp. WRRC1]
MKPLGFALGALTGAAAALILSRPNANRARPVAKAALKAAMMAYYEARAQTAQLAEAAEDLIAEAKAEAAMDIFAAAMAAAQAQAKAAAAKTQEQPAGEAADAKSDGSRTAEEAPPARAAGESA